VAAPEFDRTNAEPSIVTAHDDQDHGAPTSFEIERGTAIGRYVALVQLGAGGMGVVWAAWDPELDREIAIKLLGRRLAGPKARDRLLREAQAMARLAHPNIVAVHDVGVVDGQVFVAMEYVRGQTLRKWERGRGWSEILDAYRQAALGLAAAHDSGLVHRDFKPDNAMIDAQGRVRVMDFGLAAAYGGLDDDPDRWARGDLVDQAPPEQTSSEDSHAASLDRLALERSTSDLLSTPLTEIGVVIGTPAFMGPEQLEGLGGGPASDQFALCVSLWQALFGERPYPGDSIDALLDAIHHGRLRQPPITSKVPSRVVAALVRGLAAEPDQRWPSMSELTEQLQPDSELQPDTTRSSWRMLMLLLVTVAIVLGVLAARTQQPAEPADHCEANDTRLEDVWDAARVEAIERALQRAGSHGGAAWSRVQPAVDAWVEQWLAIGVAACRSNDGLPEQLRVAQAVCLDRSKSSLEAALEVLEHADPEVAAHALDLVLGLPSPSLCSDPEWLAALDRRPAPTNLEEARALQRGLERAKALGDAGRHRDALAVLEPLRQRAKALGDHALHGQLLDAIGLEQLTLEREADAIASLTQAYGELIRAGEDRSAAKAAVRLMLAHQGLAQIEAGRAWDLHAAALLDRIDTDTNADVELRADRLIALATLADGAGEYRESLRLYHEAIDLLEAELGPDALWLGRVLDEFGAVHSRLGELDEAEAAELRSLEILTRNLGPEHPEVGNTHFKLGNTSYRKGDLEAARAHFEQAIAIVEPALGPASAAVTGSLTGLGATQLGTGDDAGAAQSFRGALERIETALGPEHPDLVPPLANLGIALKRAKDYAGSEAVQLRALSLLERLRGPEHPDLLAVLDNLGELRLLRADPNGAREVYARSLAIGETSFGVDHPELDYALVGLGDAARALGELDEAARHYRRVLADPKREGKNTSLLDAATAGLALCG
jgi:tetratricopeptide (TPR) repeat protein